MPRKMKLEFVRNRLPVCYRHQPVIRWFMILISFSIIVYSIYFMLMFVTTNTPIFFKILPVVIGFVGLDSVLKKLSALNSLTFESDHIRLGFIAKRPILIAYKDIVELDLYKKITFYFKISYLNAQGKEMSFTTPASFPHTLEILLNLCDMAPHARIPEKMQSLLQYLRESASNGV